MTVYVYMNERIRQQRPRKPVIKADYPNGTEHESNCFEIRVDGRRIGRIIYAPRRNPSKTHRVRAWVEIDGAAVIPVCGDDIVKGECA